ncbi:hypothetical protein [Streptomyces sp. SAJ15]|uniref:hypothetical protein n=1 Tax=Streptomyces sp. SAJ15 TaxID=2011095 RepID=UPI001184F46B|nr:hypothetical protein [Streptomyces sp. SAJ15]TVL89768.1 hypothetical protein CD790_25565 [Streptomyces sp. SAJ15]
MTFERISKVMEAPDGAFVYAQADHATGQFRVVCSSCTELQKTPYNSSAGAILAASYHAEHDANQRHVPTKTK